MLHSLWLVGSTLYHSRPQPSFLCIRRIIFQQCFSVKSHLKYLRDYKSQKLGFACISSLMVWKVLGQLVTSFPRAITDYRQVCRVWKNSTSMQSHFPPHFLLTIVICILCMHLPYSAHWITSCFDYIISEKDSVTGLKSYITILFLYFSSNWTDIFTTQMYVYCL